MARIKRISNGKRKIEIKKIQSEDARQVCFSKRKAGIFSKANEIATLCGAKVAILIQSPAGCPFTFGSPSFNHVIHRFMNGGMGANEIKEYEEQRLLRTQELNNKVMEANSKREEAVGRRKLLVRRIAELCEKNEDVRRIENVDQLNLDELRKTAESLREFKKALTSKIVNSKAATLGSPTLVNLNLSSLGTGECTDNSFTTYNNSSNEGLNQVKGSMIKPDAVNVGQGEPSHIPLPKGVFGCDLVELDLLGGCVNFATGNEPK